MTDREVMQMALDALNLPSMKTMQMLQQRDEAIATLRAALEQPGQEPQPCPTCEALARTVMMDQTSHDTHPPQRKLLTGEQIEFAWIKAMQSTPGTTLPIHEFARAIEQAHDIKETP